MSDWGRGNYERTADELLPAARRTIEVAAPLAGERLLDVACGTGNAALLAAARGAQVAGIDLAPRLIEVARERAAHDGIDADFRVGDAAALPFTDDSFDVAVSVFGVIFAPAEQSAAELTRVVRSGGRVVVAGWIPGGALADAGRILREALAAGRPPEGPPPVDWGDPAVVATLFGGHGLRTSEETIAFDGPSPAAVAAALFDEHPVWLGASDALGQQRYDELRSQTETALAEQNEDPAAFRATSRYLLSVVTVA